jgi:inositol polyphosphate 5-phosphatase INPP5J/K
LTFLVREPKGNKGAVSIRMNIYGVSVCLICSHLAAHDHMLDERINDYHKIIEEHKYHVKVEKDIFSHE